MDKYSVDWLRRFRKAFLDEKVEVFVQFCVQYGLVTDEAEELLYSMDLIQE